MSPRSVETERPVTGASGGRAGSPGTTEAEGVLVVELPSAYVVTSVTAYAVPAVPPSTQLVPVVEHSAGPGLAYTRYPVTAPVAGAQDAKIAAVPGVALTDGAVAPGGMGVTGAGGTGIA